MNEIRELLHDLADEPQRSVDPAALIAAGRRRRQRRRLASALAATAVVAALGAGIFFVVPRSTPGARIHAGAPASTIVQSAGLSLSLPADWHQIPTTADSSLQLLVAGTSDQPADSIRACASPTPDGRYVIGTPTPGSAVFITIGQSDPSGRPVILGRTQKPVGPRPPAFTLENADSVMDCSASGQPVTSSPPASASDAPPGTAPTSNPTASTTPATPAPTDEPGHQRYYIFADSGRYLLLKIDAVGDPTGQLLREGVKVLNTLQVSPPGSPTLPTTTTLPRPTGPGPRDSAAARQAIQDAMNSAFNNQGPVPLQDSVQGGYPLGNTSQQAGRSANPSLIGNIVVRINWLQFLNTTHAELNFDLLTNNQPITANTTGSAVIENGQWKLSRDTYCQIIARGGTVACPPQ
jgi:hypothetical protein